MAYRFPASPTRWHHCIREAEIWCQQRGWQELEGENKKCKETTKTWESIPLSTLYIQHYVYSTLCFVIKSQLKYNMHVRMNLHIVFFLHLLFIDYVYVVWAYMLQYSQGVKLRPSGLVASFTYWAISLAQNLSILMRGKNTNFKV